MPTYKWKIQTSDTPGAGTDARVYLTLVGTNKDAEVRSKYLADTDSINDWERGDLNTGSFVAPDLGRVVLGFLQHDGGGAGSDWTVDYVSIEDEQGNIRLDEQGAGARHFRHVIGDAVPLQRPHR